MRVPGLYWWVRAVDETGISGVGIVGQCALFDDGSVAFRWTGASASAVKSWSIYDSIEDFLKIHGHGEKRTGHTVPVLRIGDATLINSMEGFGGYGVVMEVNLSRPDSFYRIKPVDQHQPKEYWAWNWEINLR